ncbi:hypothetical protein EJB05_15816, partial [Eragrostis curvula]
MVDQRWMYLQNRTCAEYLTGLKSFMIAAEADQSSQRKSAMCCPCIDCRNITKFSNAMHVHAHLIIRGFTDDYNCWNMHGEEGVNDRDMPDAEGMCADQQTGGQARGQDWEEGLSGSSDGEAPCGDQDDGHYLSEDELDDIGDNYVHIANQLEEMVRDAMGYDECANIEFGKLTKLVKDMKTPLYPGCKEKYTKLFTSLKLLQLKAHDLYIIIMPLARCIHL